MEAAAAAGREPATAGRGADRVAGGVSAGGGAGPGALLVLRCHGAGETGAGGGGAGDEASVWSGWGGGVDDFRR